MAIIRKYEARVLQAMIEMGGMEKPLHVTGLDSDDNRTIKSKLGCGTELIRRSITELRANGLVQRAAKGRWLVSSTDYKILNERPDVTPEMVQELRDKGMAWETIGKKLGVSKGKARSMIDPEYGKKWVKERDREYARKRYLYSLGSEYKPEKIERPVLIDTRNLTQILMGDPIPNDPRRALQSSQGVL